MKPVWRMFGLLAVCALLAPASFADGPAAKKTSAKKPAAAKQDAARAEKSAESTATLSSSSARVAALTGDPFAVGAGTHASILDKIFGGKKDEPPPYYLRMGSTTGGLGLFTVETGETLTKGAFSFTSYVEKFGRMPGDVTVLNVGWTFSAGITKRFGAYIRWEPHRFIHVGEPAHLSLNAPLANPVAPGALIYRRPGIPPRATAAYVEDYPFASHNSGGLGEVYLGVFTSWFAERRGHPVSLSSRNAFIIPTRTELRDLLDDQVQTGQFGYASQWNLSRNWADTIITAFNFQYRYTRDPRSGGQHLMTMADQMRIGGGMLFFPENRLQFMVEYTGLVFVGDHTPNESRAARDPVDGTWGIRFYPVRNVAFDLGYRYMLNLARHGDRAGFIVKVGTVYWPEEKKVNRAPSAACAAEKSSVYAGSDEMVRVTVTASDPDGDALNYNWTASGGRVEGSGTEVRWNSGGTAAGSYTVTARVDDGKGGMASCSVEIRVEPRPNRAPSLTCSADRTSVLVGERVRITATASDPDGDALSYAWRTNGGQIVGGGAAVQLDTTGVAAGRYTVTGRVDDGRGGANDCAVNVAVNAPPPAPEASKLNECFFRASSARVDNVCKRILDDVALRLQSDPRARVVLVGYADPREPRPERLAAARANAAKTYLGEKGIAAARVDVRTAGGQVGAGRQNRRLDVIWVPEGATY